VTVVGRLAAARAGDGAADTVARMGARYTWFWMASSEPAGETDGGSKEDRMRETLMEFRRRAKL
jgi:hypothetical protein